MPALFSVKATMISFPWPSIQKQKMVNNKNKIPGKKSHNDFSTCEIYLIARVAKFLFEAAIVVECIGEIYSCYYCYATIEILSMTLTIFTDNEALNFPKCGRR